MLALCFETVNTENVSVGVEMSTTGGSNCVVSVVEAVVLTPGFSDLHNRLVLVSRIFFTVPGAA